MSQENVEIVVRSLNAWGRGDRDAARATYDPDAVMILPVIDSRELHGLRAMETAVEAWRRSWDDFRADTGETIDAGETVVVAWHQHGVGKATGAPVELLGYGVFTLRDSKIIRAEFFENKDEALEAAGLRE